MKKRNIYKGGFILLVLLLAYCCESEMSDIRNPYTGEFNFTTISNIKSMCYDTSLTCVNGWTRYNFDTMHITTYIELFSENKLKIHFGDGVLGHGNGSTYNQIFFPELLPDGNLYFPDYPRGGHNCIEGSFLGYDTLKINFHFGFLNGGYDEYWVTGIRNN